MPFTNIPERYNVWLRVVAHIIYDVVKCKMDRNLDVLLSLRVLVGIKCSSNSAFSSSQAEECTESSHVLHHINMIFIIYGKVYIKIYHKQNAIIQLQNLKKNVVRILCGIAKKKIGIRSLFNFRIQIQGIQ